MNYLLDTNIISEVRKPNANPNVVQWFNKTDSLRIYLSVLTIGEIRRGIEKIANSKKKIELYLWLDNELPKMFISRILPISFEVADRWGRLLAEAQRTLPAIDSLLAATALHHDMTLVTRNEMDFTDCPGLQILNPLN